MPASRASTRASYWPGCGAILAHNLFNEARRDGARQRDAGREVSLDHVQAGVDHSSFTLERCLAAEGPSPSQLALQHESAVRLADALARLPDDYQTVLRLRLFEELSAEEVALCMERTLPAPCACCRCAP